MSGDDTCLYVVVLQHGFIQVGGEQYFIEPVKGHSEVADDTGHPHLVYRRSALPQHQPHQQTVRSSDVSMCGLEDAGEHQTALHMRLLCTHKYTLYRTATASQRRIHISLKA